MIAFGGRDSQLIFGTGSIEWETVGWPLCPLGGMGLTRYVALLFDPMIWRVSLLMLHVRIR